MKRRVLVVDDEKLIRWSLAQTMSRAGHEVFEARGGLEALRIAEAELPDVILLDLRLPEMDGLTVLSELALRQIESAVVVISAHSDLDTAVEAMRRGADDFVKKPFDAEEVVLVVERALERRATARELERHRRQAEDAYRIDRLVGTSEAIAELREIVGRVAASEARGVLVRGEAGTGKGLVAHLLHFGSRRREAPFVRLSVRGRDEEVLEREIFGYEKSALPEASAATRGLIERASGGTVYIEEVADLPLICQARLLDVLEDGAVRRVGGVRALNVDVRVVAATHHDLPARVRAGSFREDLYYRLSAVPIDLPPLRERLEDLPELSGSLMDELAPEIGRTFEPLSEAALARLRRHTWPGNVRELRNVLERAMIHAVGSAIDPEDLVLHPTEASVVDTETLTLEEMEKEMIRRALAACGGNQAQAARRLGISRDTLRYRIKKYGL